MPTKAENRTGLVCPECYQQQADAQMQAEPYNDGLGRLLRRYMVHCCACNISAEVEQYQSRGRWHIHRVQYYDIIDGLLKRVGDYEVICDLPAPAPVVTGQGDFALGHDLDDIEPILTDVNRLLAVASTACKSMATLAAKLNKDLRHARNKNA